MHYATNCAQSNHWGESGIFDNSEKKQEKKKDDTYGAPIDHRSKRW